MLLPSEQPRAGSTPSPALSTQVLGADELKAGSWGSLWAVQWGSPNFFSMATSSLVSPPACPSCSLGSQGWNHSPP